MFEAAKNIETDAMFAAHEPSEARPDAMTIFHRPIQVLTRAQ